MGQEIKGFRKGHCPKILRSLETHLENGVWQNPRNLGERAGGSLGCLSSRMTSGAPVCPSEGTPGGSKDDLIYFVFCYI